MSGLLALLALAAAALLLGRGVARWTAPATDAAERWLWSGVAGVVLLYGLLLGLHLAGVPWRRGTLIAVLGVAVAVSVAAAVRGRERPEGASPPARLRDLGWGGAVAVASFAVFVAATALLWNLHPDFVFHWGIKAQKFALAGGLDFEYLSRPWYGHLHPDYPNLLPSICAATAVLAGGFDELPMALWSAFYLALLLLAGDAFLRRLGVSTFARRAGVALLALLSTMFGVGYLQAAGADWLIALALLAAAVPLTSPPSSSPSPSLSQSPAADLQLGAAAALAAASKIEGVPLAAFLVAVHLFRRWRLSGAGNLRGAVAELLPAALRSGLPALVLGGVWLYQVRLHGLFQATNTGDFDLGRAAVVFPELFRSLLTVNWHGLTFTLFALPFLLVSRRLRPVAGVALLQLGFYVYVYLAAPVDTRLYVFTSAARLYFHLVPAALLATLAALDLWTRGTTYSIPGAK